MAARPAGQYSPSSREVTSCHNITKFKLPITIYHCSHALDKQYDDDGHEISDMYPKIVNLRFDLTVRGGHDVRTS